VLIISCFKVKIIVPGRLFIFLVFIENKLRKASFFEDIIVFD